MSRTRKIDMTDLYLFKDRQSISRFRRSTPGDLLDIKGEGISISVVVCAREANSEIKCPCVFEEYSALCANADCSKYEYKNLDSILENI